MRDVEPYSIIYPVYLSVNVINAEIGEHILMYMYIRNVMHMRGEK